MFSIKQKAHRKAKRAGFLSVGLLLLTVAAGFLTLAGWFQLRLDFSPVHSAFILTAVFAGVGMVLTAVAINHGRTDTSPQPDHPAYDTPPLIKAFLYGLQAGSRPKR